MQRGFDSIVLDLGTPDGRCVVVEPGRSWRREPRSPVLFCRTRVMPSWHYHLQDFETLIAGYLCGQGKPLPPLPWRSDELSRLIGVEPPGEAERHTALGDARWAARAWDAVMSGAS